MKNITTFILGVGLLIASIAIMALVANLFNPPAVEVFIAVEDIPLGDLIQPHMVSVISAKLENSLIISFSACLFSSFCGFVFWIAAAVWFLLCSFPDPFLALFQAVVGTDQRVHKTEV